MKLKPDFATCYDIQPGNRSELFHSSHGWMYLGTFLMLCGYKSKQL